jgi:hypothetical protein
MNALIEQGLKGEGENKITIYRDATILDAHMSSNNEVSQIVSITIRRNPPKNSIMGPKDETILCGALLCCSNEQCDVDTFTAVNECGLVYDGGIVVNEVKHCTHSRNKC